MNELFIPIKTVIIMDKIKIAGHFKKHFNGNKNIMTPEIVEYRNKNNYLIEISRGEGLYHETIYGVTVLKLNDQNETEKTDLSYGGLRSMKDVEFYIDENI